MFNVVKKSIEWAGQTLEIETGRIARQAGGAVLVRFGDTSVLCTATSAKEPKAGIDFFPLTCVYQEKAFAAGKIPGGFFKRESRPSENETLVSRLIDRPIRPLFESGFCNDTQVITTVLEYDRINNPDIPAIVGAAAALAISGLPFNGPLAAARVGLVDDEFILNPTMDDMEETSLDLIVAGTKSSVMMVESEASELSEKKMLEAVVFAHEGMQPVIDLITEFAAEAGKERWVVEKPDHSELADKIKSLAEAPLRAAYQTLDKQERRGKIDSAKADAIEGLQAELAEGDSLDSSVVSTLFKKLEQKIVRGSLIETKKRIDGRSPTDIRQIVGEVGVLPGTHGSALFTRGETQALVVATLGTGDDEQRYNSLHDDGSQHFLLHYNFPPYSVGETQMLRGPGRREIGHGKLAWRALNPLMPSKDQFPYTIRLVSEITESNGSSSMATVCGSSLAMMDAGVPLARPCSGIAMGLILEGEDFVVLSDILGDEDHLGDMDFKVAGTEEGITSLQMDIKIQGITTEIMEIALNQANEGRNHILNEMANTLTESRGTVNDNAPKITTIKVPVDKIREVIGSGGKVIREICETSGAKIDIQDDGTINVAAVDGQSAQIALNMIEDIVAEAEEGVIYHDCRVIKVVDFGAFVEFLGKNQGLVHISELAPYRVNAVTDIIQENDHIKVKCIGIDKQGKVKLSMKSVDQETGDDISDQVSRPKRQEG